MKYLLLVVLIAFAACTTATNAPAEKTQDRMMETTAQAETPVQAAPAFSIEKTSGGTLSLQEANAEGKPVVVYFMASWCPTCAKNWAALNEVYPEYEDRVEFIAVSVDPTDTKPVLEQLAIDRGFKFATSPGNPELAQQYQVTKQTAKFAIDKEGNIVERHDGALSAEEWRAFFDQLL